MMKMNGADAFERSLKEALETYEVPYNSADWAQLEQKLDGKSSSNWQASAGLYALFLGGAVAVMTTVWYFMSVDDGSGGASSGIAMVTSDDAEDPVRNYTMYSDTEKTELATAATDEPILEEIPEPAGTGATASIKPAPAEKIASAPVKTKAAERPGTGTATARTSGTDEPVANAKAITIKPSVTEGCPGTTVEFAVENMPGDGIHLWNFGDGSFSNKPSPTHTFSKAGTFEVMLSHSSLGGGNIHNKPAADRIIIHEAPEASFHFRKDEDENTVPSVRFENRSIGGNKYHWDFGDGSTTEIAHPNHVFKKKGTYQVTLTTTNAKGCLDRTDRTIVIDNDYNLLAPTTFSPDGNGFEDTFIPEALKTLGAKFHMSIFDSTTGAMLYETTDPERPWNGRINNKGEFCSPGEYVWLVEMKDGEILGGTYTGNVSLHR